MAKRFKPLLAILIALCCNAQRSARAQEPQPEATSPAYTLHTSARTVLMDVSVTDEQGKPVHGLDQSAFRIFDDGKPQRLTSFEAHQWQPPAQLSLVAQAPDTFSNNFLVHPPPVLNVMMLDTSTIDFAEQAYLSEELTTFIKNLPAGEQLAVFVHAAEYTVLLQDFTADHSVLLTALAKAIPRLQQQGHASAADAPALSQIAAYLQPLPGRKNVMWFTAGPRLRLSLDPINLAQGADEKIYDLLEQARIALYPIDVRGPILGDQSSRQKARMEEQARATGGRAYLNTNGLADSALSVVEDGGSFYTLSYALTAAKLDNAWHNVSVTVAGAHYQVSYRQGYYDDGSAVKPVQKGPRTKITTAGETIKLPENRAEPIIFSAKLTLTPPGLAGAPASPVKHGELTYTLHYRVPIAAFNRTQTPDGDELQVGAGVFVVNSFGRVVNRVSQTYTLTYAADKLEQNPDGMASYDLFVSLPKGEDYLSLVTWDIKTGRMGRLQVPVVVKD